MFIHNFKYSFRTLFRNKMLIFWTFAFPIILGTLFNMAFSDIENSEKLDIIDIAIVDNEAFRDNELFKEVFEMLSEDNEEKLFDTQYVTEEEAIELLNDDKIDGYLILTSDNSKVVVKSSGINQTILKYVTEQINQNSKIVENIIAEKINKELSSENYNIDYDEIYQYALSMTQNDEIKIKNISSNNLSYTMIEFYTLIAMACLYGGILGMVSINQNLANMSSKGKRIAVSPINKFKLILSSVCASYVTQVIGLLLLFVYTIFILNVDYGNNLLLIIILALAGCFAGLSMGIFTSTSLKMNEGSKLGVIISVTMMGCFLSGMMGITMKYIVDKNIPILNKINPASMITDGFYALYYYDTLDRYWFNLVSLIIFAFVMIMLSFISLRRQKYDSI